LRDYAELALRLGDSEQALGLARRAAVDEPDFDVVLTLGRATRARGDLTAARALLEQAASRAASDVERSSAALELTFIAKGLPHTAQAVGRPRRSKSSSSTSS
jgi:thioredoxin-like negative regulator of GroEL